jgi:hypothetical protein
MPTRRIVSPTKYQKIHGGAEHGQPVQPFSGKVLNATFVEGVAEVPEDLMWPLMDCHTMKDRDVPTWHWLVQDLGYLDETDPAQEAQYPLPDSSIGRIEPKSRVPDAEHVSLAALLAEMAQQRTAPEPVDLQALVQEAVAKAMEGWTAPAGTDRAAVAQQAASAVLDAHPAPSKK